MSLAYHAAYDFARIGTFSGTFSTIGAVSVSTGVYSNITWAGVANATGYDCTIITDFATKLDLMLGGTYAVSFNATTSKYTIARPGSPFTASGLSTVAQQILGTASTAIASTESFTSTNLAYYSILSSSGARSNPHEYEREGSAGDGAADDGTPAGWAATTFPKFYDWEQQAETLAATWTADLVSTVPWTYERMFQHCRTTNPFLVVDTKTIAHMLVQNGAHFDPRRLFDNYNGQWSIPFKTRILGRV